MNIDNSTPIYAPYILSETGKTIGNSMNAKNIRVPYGQVQYMDFYSSSNSKQAKHNRSLAADLWLQMWSDMLDENHWIDVKKIYLENSIVLLGFEDYIRCNSKKEIKEINIINICF